MLEALLRDRNGDGICPTDRLALRWATGGENVREMVVTKLLTIAKLDTVIDVFDTEAEALNSFGV